MRYYLVKINGKRVVTKYHSQVIVQELKRRGISNPILVQEAVWNSTTIVSEMNNPSELFMVEDLTEGRVRFITEYLTPALNHLDLVNKHLGNYAIASTQEGVQVTVAGKVTIFPDEVFTKRSIRAIIEEVGGKHV